MFRSVCDPVVLEKTHTKQCLAKVQGTKLGMSKIDPKGGTREQWQAYPPNHVQVFGNTICIFCIYGALPTTYLTITYMVLDCTDSPYPLEIGRFESDCRFSMA